MSIHINCDKEYTCMIHIVVTGRWTWNDFYVAMDELHQQLDVSEHETVNLILDIRDSNYLPQYLLSNMRQVSFQRHPKSGMMIVVGADRFPRMMFETMRMLLPEQMQSIHLLDTIDEAYKLICGKNLCPFN